MNHDRRQWQTRAPNGANGFDVEYRAAWFGAHSPTTWMEPSVASGRRDGRRFDRRLNTARCSMREYHEKGVSAGERLFPRHDYQLA
jgi:hypothetical protein